MWLNMQSWGTVAQENGTQNLPEKKRNNSPDWLLMWKALVTAQTFAFGCKQKEEPQNALSSITRPAEIISDQKVGRRSLNHQSTKMATQSFGTMILSGLQDVLFLGLSLFPLLRSLRRVWWDKPPDAWVAKGKGLGIVLAYR
ncbi:hypothetical protein H105_08852 [Trichophyton soudanense CBS 452.61]|uniref:Uncharacterized protein n=1 Tax=Trichophyton soudanense CBS 452.61 TaxID=1215331 RepID=A0A022XDW7_TRISD|nr:hypothetical protein H105_08852 [Trichophyton soudanense CBS 452.61]